MKYLIETISSFHEVYCIEAENEKEAQEIYEKYLPDSNYSKHIGESIILIYPKTEESVKRFSDEYFDFTTKITDNKLIYE